MKLMPIFEQTKGKVDYLAKVKMWRPMTRADVISYFKSIIPKTMAYRERGAYCERCGRLMGFTYKKTYDWKGFNLCESCLEDKEEGLETTPDLEDIERFGLNIEFPKEVEKISRQEYKSRWYKRKSQDPEWVKKNREYCKEYYAKHREYLKALKHKEYLERKEELKIKYRIKRYGNQMDN